MAHTNHHPDLSTSSPVFPGGSLISAVFDRDLMRLSDRGGASGMIGDRWSDVCTMALDEWPGKQMMSPDGEDVTVERIVRLDDIPAVARLASRRKLQNPDFIVMADSSDGRVMFSVDAKFSVETASASQVSADALRSLVELGAMFTDHLGELGEGRTAIDGLFLCPDYSLTHYMLGRRKGGYRSVSVDRQQIELLPVKPVAFLKPLEGARIIPILADVDGYDLETRRNLLVALYYFRLVRACIGCWVEQVTPLLGPRSSDDIDLATVEARTRKYARDAQSGWQVVERWDAAAETVRTQRETVNRITSVPIVNRELREELDAAVAATRAEAPSMNKVRRRIGSWFRDQVIQRVGVIETPVEDFPGVVRQLEIVSGELREQLPAATTRIIHEMLEEPTETLRITAQES